ncbi:MAG: hypothetical protein RR012_01200 [Oscillospiraceae bacterium]
MAEPNIKEKVLTDIMTILGASTSFDRTFVDTVLSRLVSLGYTLLSDDGWAIAFSIQSVENEVKNSCNVLTVPEKLKPSIVDTICGEFLLAKKQSGKLLTNFNLETAIKSIQTGDTNITFAVGNKEGSQTTEQRLDSLIYYLRTKGRGEFVCYRKLKW